MQTRIGLEGGGERGESGQEFVRGTPRQPERLRAFTTGGIGHQDQGYCDYVFLRKVLGSVGYCAAAALSSTYYDPSAGREEERGFDTAIIVLPEVSRGSRKQS